MLYISEYCVYRINHFFIFRYSRAPAASLEARRKRDTNLARLLDTIGYPTGYQDGRQGVADRE